MLYVDGAKLGAAARAHPRRFAVVARGVAKRPVHAAAVARRRHSQRVQHLLFQRRLNALQRYRLVQSVYQRRVVQQRTVPAHLLGQSPRSGNFAHAHPRRYVQ